MSQVQISCGVSPNSLRWKLGKSGGHAFDDLLFDILTKELKQQDPDVILRQTPRVGDRGRDIEIVTAAVLRFAGVSIHPPAAAQHTILVEVKTVTSASRPRLSLSAFGKNYLQIRELAYSHFVLVTNASISPRSARETADVFSAAGKQFVLIDEYLLWRLLESHGVTSRLPKRLPLQPTDLVVETQVERTLDRESIILDVDFVLRNYSNVPRRVTIENISDLTWRQSVPEVTRTIEPGRFEALHLLARSIGRESGDMELRIHDQDGTEYPLRFEAQDIAFDFKPPLVGERHHFCLSELAQVLASEVPSRLINVIGGAGRGKTRLIEEALGRTQKAMRKVVRAVIDPDRPDVILESVIHGIHIALGENENREDRRPLSTDLSTAARLNDLLLNLDHPLYSFVIVLEDLHHASDNICTAIRNFLRVDRKGRCPLSLVISGRDDYSFPNDAYFALLDVLAHTAAEALDVQKTHVTTHRIPDFTASDSRELIRAIVRDAPPYAIERLEVVGENVPFFIVQTIEYMLETGIAVLLSRESVGIPNPAVFGSREGFPAAMKSILEGRLSALERIATGVQVRHFLEVACFFGQILPQDLEIILLGGIPADAAETLLIGRRFLKRSDDGSLQWYHENILHLLQEIVRDTGRATPLTREIASTPALFAHFEGWRAGRILSEAGRHSDAWPYFGDITTLAEGMTNFSSVNVDATCFDYLDFAFESAIACKEPSSRLVHLLLLHTYIAVHHRSGKYGPETAMRSLSRLSRIGASDEELGEARAKITELRAHGLLDTGEVGPATKLFLELEGAIKQPDSPLRQPDLLFDLYNRLQDVYRMHNHLAVCERYGELADRMARGSGELRAVAMLDSAIVYHYIDTARCIRLHEEALAFARSFGTRRHVAHIEVGLIVASLSQAQGNVGKLRGLMERSTDVLRRSLDESYGSLLARIYLTMATIAHLLAAQGDMAWPTVEKYIDLSMNAAITYRAGYDVWMIYNLKAIAALRAGRPIKETGAYFTTALQLLRRSSLLFLGNLDLTFENIIVVSNILRFLSEHGNERERFSLALEIRYYDDMTGSAEGEQAANFALARARFARLEHDIRAHRILGQPAVPNSVLFDPDTGYAICVTC